MKDRAKNLSKFQFKILSKALQSDSAKFVVYSTCSIYREENEKVVHDVARKNRNWSVVDLSKVDIGLPERYMKGLHIEDGRVRVCPGCGPAGYLSGFFLTIFERTKRPFSNQP